MTHPDWLHAQFLNWYQVKGPVPCAGPDRITLNSYVAQVYPNKTQKQINRTARDLLRKYRPIISPESTPRRFQKKAIGALTSTSHIMNTIANRRNKASGYTARMIARNKASGYTARNNARNNAKRKAQNRLYSQQQAQKNNFTNEKLLVEERDILPILNPIIKKIDNYLKNHQNFIFYVGATGQDPTNEYLRWLTQRGKPIAYKNGVAIYGGARNRPTLLKTNGQLVGMKEAKSKFTLEVVYETKHKCNVRLIEDRLQAYYQDKLQLGQRLWRCVAKGGNIANHETKTVFITYSLQSPQQMGYIIQK